MTTHDPAPRAHRLPTPADVDNHIVKLRAELARSDAKASLLLALTGGGLAALLSITANAHIPTAALAVGTLGAAALLAATLTLLCAVRPSLNGTGWPTWPELNDIELGERVAVGHTINEVRLLAAISRTKFRRVRIAVDLALTALVLITSAAAIAA